MDPDEFARAFGGEERVAWMRTQRSILSGRRPCVSAHVRGGGVSRRADACWTVPVTWDEHQAMHTSGQTTYVGRFGLTQEELEQAAIETERRWQAERARWSLPW